MSFHMVYYIYYFFIYKKILSSMFYIFQDKYNNKNTKWKKIFFRL